MPTLWNTVGKVKNIKLYNIRLIRLFHSLHSMQAISLEVTRICIHALIFTWYYKHLPAKHSQQTVLLSQASSNRTPQLKNVLQKDRGCSHVRSKCQMPHVELTAITWHRAVCNRFCGYVRRAWNFANPGLNYTEVLHEWHNHTGCPQWTVNHLPHTALIQNKTCSVNTARCTLDCVL